MYCCQTYYGSRGLLCNCEWESWATSHCFILSIGSFVWFCLCAFVRELKSNDFQSNKKRAVYVPFSARPGSCDIWLLPLGEQTSVEWILVLRSMVCCFSSFVSVLLCCWKTWNLSPPPKSLYLTLAEIACYSLVGLSNLTIILNSDTVTTQLVSDSPKVGDCPLFPSAPSFVSLLLLSPEN